MRCCPYRIPQRAGKVEDSAAEKRARRGKTAGESAQANPGRRIRSAGGSVKESRVPPVELAAELIEPQAAVIGGKLRELVPAAAEERFGADAIAAKEVEEGGRDLNDALEKSFVGFRGGKPENFPRFVSFEKLAGVEQADAAGEGIVVGCGIRIHEVAGAIAAGCLSAA